MVAPDSSASRIRFGTFELDLDHAELTRRGVPIRLQPQPLNLLTILVRAAGHLVTHDEIREKIRGSAIVPTDAAIHSAVSQLRHALGDRAQSPLYIETVARRGYRFVAPVEVVGAPGSRALKRKRWLTVAAAAGLTAVSVVAAVRFVPDTNPAPRLQLTGATHTAYVKAGHFLGQRDWESSVEWYQKVIHRQPTFAPALVGEAEARLNRGEEDDLTRAREAIDKAMSIDPSLARAHYLDGRLRALAHGLPQEVLDSLERAVKLDPGSALFRVAYGMQLANLGHTQMAFAEIEEAMRLDPVTASLRGDAGLTYFLAGDYARAIDHCRAAIQIEPKHVAAHWCLLRSFAELGDLSQAMDQAQALMRIFHVPEESREALDALPVQEAMQAFWQGQAGWFADRGQQDNRYNVLAAVVYAHVGNFDQALAHLERAEASIGAPNLMTVKADPAFAPIHGDPRFESLTRRLGFTE